jgi:hypothetical protein
MKCGCSGKSVGRIKMSNQTFLNLIKKFKPCDAAIDWIKSLPESSPEEIWEACERRDWMCWLADKAQIERKLFVLSACEIARTVLHLIPKGEERPLAAIEAAEGWCRGEINAEKVRKVAKAVEEVIEIAEAAAETAAVVGAGEAGAEAAATYYAGAAAYAAAVATYINDNYTVAPAAAGDVASAAACKEAGKQHCIIIRKHISWKDINLG